MATVRETSAMIAGMDPELRPGAFVFATSDAPDLVASAAASVEEPEGRSLLLPEPVARAAGFEGPAMAWIVLRVASDLEGVGLTAAAAGALAARGLPCNVVAGHRHDHLLVPADRAEEAVEALRLRALEERG